MYVLSLLICVPLLKRISESVLDYDSEVVGLSMLALREREREVETAAADSRIHLIFEKDDKVVLDRSFQSKQPIQIALDFTSILAK